MRVLVTTANGMFGNAVVRQLVQRDLEVRAMVRNPAKFTFAHPRVQVIAADLDRPETLDPAMAGVDAVFLASPMDDKLAERELAAIDALTRAGVSRVVRIGGAVRHEGDRLSALHGAVIARLEASDLAWTYVSPNSVMETSLLGSAPAIRQYGGFIGMSGKGRVGLVALQDVAEAAAVVLSQEGHGRRNYEITGPAALDLFEVAEVFSRVLGRPVAYQDLPEAQFKAMMAPIMRMSDEDLEMNLLCHLRCWKEGKADLVTDTFERLAGHPPTSLEAWIGMNREAFG